jgi:hypothetical protein
MLLRRCCTVVAPLLHRCCTVVALQRISSKNGHNVVAPLLRFSAFLIKPEASTTIFL